MAEIGQYSNRHPAIGVGTHRLISKEPYSFSRTYNKQEHKDWVILVIGASGNQKVNASSIFLNGPHLRDHYTGHKSIVSNSQVLLPAHSNGVMLIEGDH